MCVCARARARTQSCLTLCSPMACSLPGSSVLGIFQARILEWVAIPYSCGSSQPRDQTQVSCSSYIGRQILTTAPPGKHLMIYRQNNNKQLTSFECLLDFKDNTGDFALGGSDGKVCLQCGRSGFNPWVGKISWRRK